MKLLESSKSPVIKEIVNKDICIGCGICAGICSQKYLIMQFNDCGEYIPNVQQNCNCNLCNRCLNVCPFYNENEIELTNKFSGNVENIKFQSETGYYLDSYAGYSQIFRGKSASGGMTTWLLTVLLREKFVDYVISVTSIDNKPDKLFKYTIFENEDSISSSSGSVYYPVELSQIIKKILDKSGRYAIVGLPCFIKGLTLACQENIKLMERIVFKIGLVCGQTKSKNYTKYLSTLAKVDGNLKYVNYRGKSTDRPAIDFYFYCINEKGIEGKIFWNEGVSQAWVNRWFTPNACNFCEDIFAELADITFMDAWLPEYSWDNKGTNLIIIRSAIIRDIILKGITHNEININKIGIKKIIQSQKGVINFKRRFKASYLTRLDVKNKIDMQNASKKYFSTCYQENSLDVNNFRIGMMKYLNKSKFINILMFPSKIIQKFMYIIEE